MQSCTEATQSSSGVSVVIPAYNYAHFLKEAIDSALAQDHQPVEVLVVDDGSKDNTREVCEAYGESIRYLWKENGGLSSARNAGIEAAKFPWIGFLDADDRWDPRFLSTAMSCRRELGEKFVVIAAGTALMDRDGRDIGLSRWHAETGREYCSKDILLASRFSPSAVVASREVLLAAGLFDCSLTSSEDRDMWIRCASKGRIWYHGKPLLTYRMHASSMSKNALRMMANNRRVIEKAFGQSIGADLITRSKVWSFYHFQAAWMYYESGHRFQAIASMLRSFLRFPFGFGEDNPGLKSLFRLRQLACFCLRPFRGEFVPGGTVSPSTSPSGKEVSA